MSTVLYIDNRLRLFGRFSCRAATAHSLGRYGISYKMSMQELSFIIGKYYASQFQAENQILKTEITKEEYDRISELNKSVRRMLYFKNKALECSLNYLDYFSVYDKYLLQLINPADGKLQFDLEFMQADINRVFNNFVISFKSLTENSEKMIIRKYSANDKAFKEYKRYTSQHYDTLFSYRLFQIIRDYTVHYDQAIHLNIEFRENMNIFLNQHFRKSELLRFKDIKRKCSMHLESYDEIFLVEPLMIEIKDFIENFYPNIVKILSTSEKENFEELLKFYRKYKSNEIDNMSLAIPKSILNEKLDISFVQLDIHEALNIEKILT